jgi:diguanylate cyclase (GGDEF)-like protein
MDSLFSLLFWGNLIALVFLFLYCDTMKRSVEWRLGIQLIVSRVCHTIYYFVALGRGDMPDWLSVSIGNALLFIGFYFEALAILRILKVKKRFIDRFLRVTLLVSLLVFNIMEFVMSSGGMRITLASLSVVALMALPTFRMLASKDSGRFTKAVGVCYSLYLCLLLVRARYGLEHQEMEILTNNTIQSITFLSQMLQLMMALPAYTLILKSYSDEALYLMATTDHLTGATNRHAFLEAATAIYHNCRRYNISMSVLFIDVLDFKSINDRNGHAMGDMVLARLASVIDQNLRDSDLSCRYGGDEFVVLLSHADAETARLVSNRITAGVSEARFPEKPGFTFSVNIGAYSGIPTEKQTLDDAIRLADEAMYRDKRGSTENR